MQEIQARYAAQARSTDPMVRMVAKRQLDRLNATARTSSADGQSSMSRWAHVPLVDLFEQAGNRLHTRNNGALETGHEPMHGSKSGRCVSIDPTRGLWYCSSCRRGGDAVTFVRDLHALSYRDAAAWLSQRYGPPAEGHYTRRQPGKRLELTSEVIECTSS